MRGPILTNLMRVEATTKIRTGCFPEHIMLKEVNIFSLFFPDISGKFLFQ